MAFKTYELDITGFNGQSKGLKKGFWRGLILVGFHPEIHFFGWKPGWSSSG